MYNYNFTKFLKLKFFYINIPLLKFISIIQRIPNKINTLLTAHRTRATKQSERNQTYLKYNRNRTRAELNQNI